MSHRQVYIVAIAALGFLTAVDGGILSGVIPSTEAVRVGAIVGNMALGSVCAVLPAWNTKGPLPPPPKPPPLAHG